MNLKEFRDNLCELIPSGKVYHFIVPTDVKEAYIVWNETGIEYTFYDNICCERTYVAKVSYRTRTEYDDLPEKIEEDSIRLGHRNYLLYLGSAMDWLISQLEKICKV